MAIASGTRLGPYEIVSTLGTGGMGEVYRAKDTRLDRTVAIKVLPSHLSADPAFRQRFEREARTISSLSHPNICALHDVGHQDGIDYLVMEFLEGETLANRLTRGALSRERALQYGIQISDALDKAHKQGIVHRDLKPGNIMLTKSGAKLLDFGLAKLNFVPESAPAVSALETEQKDLTKEGTIVGTIQYMAPEQLEGKSIDVRTDIFAFGEVLYEMLTGKKAFTGKSQASLIAAILEKDPQPISEIQPMTPPALDRVVKICLAKDPDDRWQSAHDVMSELKWISEAGSQAGVPATVLTKRKSRERLAWILAGIFFLATLVSAIAFYRSYKDKQPVRPIYSSIIPPKGNEFRFSLHDAGSLTLSPDGRWVTFPAADSSGKIVLWLRALDSLEARVLPGTELQGYPFWSSDSRFIAFFSLDGKLKKLDIAGGVPFTICDALDGRGGTWNQEGIILFSPGPREPIYRVSAAGGIHVAVTTINKSIQEISHRLPYFLPDGKHFLYLALNQAGVSREDAKIYVASLNGKENKFLMNSPTKAVYANGFLLFVREKVLMGQRFDPGPLELKGESFPIVEQINFDRSQGTFAVSGQALLAYVKDTTTPTRLTWLDRYGKKIGEVGEPDFYTSVSLSADNKKAAFSIRDSASRNEDIWLYDLIKNVRTRFTFDPADDLDPLWVPDGSRIVFWTLRNGNQDIYQKSSTGIGQEEPLVQTKADEWPWAWSADGRFLSYHYYDSKGKTKTDIWILPTFGDRKPFPFLQTQFDEYFGVFSPDGRWLAYGSDESGKPEVYVTPFPSGNYKWQVSRGGGFGPAKWVGTEIAYFSTDFKFMSVEVRTEPEFESGTPVQLFDYAPEGVAFTADGQRILALLPETASDEPITLVANWTAALPR